MLANLSVLLSVWLVLVPLDGVRGEGATAVLQADTPEVLATVHLPIPVWADSKPLPAGTYELRPATTLPQFGEGQKPCGSCWIEFVQDGVVRGREQATIVPENEGAIFATGPRPERNGYRAEALSNNSYVQIWMNRDGKDYIIHLPATP